MEFIYPRNPTRKQRHQLLRRALTRLKRREDLNPIIDAAAIPPNILTIAPPQRFKHIKIGIIGAGLAGLAASYELSKLGADITLFEASPNRIGGRVYTHYFSEEHYGELGAHRIPVSHEATWYYIDHFKLNTIPFIPQSPLDKMYINGVRIEGANRQNDIMVRLYPRYQLNEWEVRTPLNKLKEYALNQALVHLTPFDREQLHRVQEYYSPAIDYLDSINFYQACYNLGFSHDGVQLLSQTMELERDFFYHSYLSLLREMYGAHYSYSYRIEGGNSLLPQAFYDALSQKPNVTFKFGHVVTAISLDPHSLEPMISYRHNHESSQEVFDFIICAIPFSRLRLIDINPLFSNRKMQAIQQVHYNGAQRTVLLCKRRFWEVGDLKISPGGNVITDLTIRTLSFPTHENRDEKGVLLITQTNEQDAIRLGNISRAEWLEILKRDLSTIYGLSIEELDELIIDVQTLNWHQNPYSLGAFCWYKPDQNTLLAYASTTPEYNYRVFFAGEHTSPYHAWMQGALQSGALAANQVAAELISSGPFIPSY